MDRLQHASVNQPSSFGAITVTSVNAGDIYQDGLLTTQIAQIVTTQSGAVATGTTTVPFDDSIPSDTEGDQYLSRSITPKSASSTLFIDTTIIATSSVNTFITVALFTSTATDAIAAVTEPTTNDNPHTIPLRHSLTSGATGSLTFNVRVGCAAAGTTTVNGLSAARKYGGVAASKITITEILP